MVKNKQRTINWTGHSLTDMFMDTPLQRSDKKCDNLLEQMVTLPMSRSTTSTQITLIYSGFIYCKVLASQCTHTCKMQMLYMTIYYIVKVL